MRWRTNGFVRDVIAVGSGAAAAQIVLALASPFITRIYGPEIFGVWGVFNSIASIIYPAIALTYSTAIVLPKNPGHARSIVRLSFWVTLFMSIVTTAVFVIFGEQIGDALSIGNHALVLTFIGGYVFAVGLATIGQQWLIRTRGFKDIAVSNVTFASFTALAQIIGGWIHPSAFTLVASNTAGRSVHALLLMTFVKLRSRKDHSVGSERRHAREIKLRARIPMCAMATEYKQFPLFRAPQVVLDGLAQAIPVVAIAGFFGPGPAGFYALCRTVLSLPGQVIGNAVGDVFYGRIAVASQNREPLTRLVGRATIMLFLTLAVPFVIVIIFGPWLFGLVFGDEWRPAGEFARWMSIWLWVVVTNRPAVQAIHVLGKQRFHLLFTVVSIAVRTVAIILPAFYGLGAVVTVIVFSIVGAAMNIILIGMVLQFCRRRDERITKVSF